VPSCPTATLPLPLPHNCNTATATATVYCNAATATATQKTKKRTSNKQKKQTHKKQKKKDLPSSIHFLSQRVLAKPIMTACSRKHRRHIMRSYLQATNLAPFDAHGGQLHARPKIFRKFTGVHKLRPENHKKTTKKNTKKNTKNKKNKKKGGITFFFFSFRPHFFRIKHKKTKRCKKGKKK
jgi:hypothetical protein